jgi:hypothetical protein
MRGEVTRTKVVYKGAHENFIVFIDGVPEFRRWQGDKSVPLSQVVSSFKVFTTHGYVWILFPSLFLRLWGIV